MVNPFRMLSVEGLCYAFDGKPFRSEEMYKKGPGSVLLAVPLDFFDGPYNNPEREMNDRLREAKAFTMRYVVPMLYGEIEGRLRAGWGPPLEKIERRWSDYPELFRRMENNFWSEKNFKEKVLWHSAEQRKEMVKTAVEEMLKPITVERIRADMKQLLPGIDKYLMGSMHEAPLMSYMHEDVSEKDIHSWLRRMPEWMQVLTHAIGGYALISDNITEKRGAAALSFGRGRDRTAPMGICLHNKTCHWPTDELHHVWREELLHELAVRILHPPVESDFLKAAETLIQKIDANPEKSPALALIKKTEDHGGSLMKPALSTDDSPFYRASELLVDVFDAESYLRRQRRTKQETEDELRAAFGDNVYEGSRQYLKIWIDQAAKLLRREVGAEEANRYREKWEENPFEHSIALSHLPKFRPEESAGRSPV